MSSIQITFFPEHESYMDAIRYAREDLAGIMQTLEPHTPAYKEAKRVLDLLDKILGPK